LTSIFWKAITEAFGFIQPRFLLQQKQKKLLVFTAIGFK